MTENYFLKSYDFQKIMVTFVKVSNNKVTFSRSWIKLATKIGKFFQKYVHSSRVLATRPAKHNIDDGNAQHNGEADGLGEGSLPVG